MRYLLVVVSMFLVSSWAFSQEGEVERVYHPTKHRAEKVAGKQEEKLPPISEWDAFQFAIAPGFPSSTRNSNVYGLKLGVPASGGNGRVWGCELSLFCSTTARIKGFQTSVFANVCDFLDGVQAGLVNVTSVATDGIQIGLVNYSDETGLQFGLVNVISKGAIPFMPIVNFQFAPKKATYIQTAPEQD